MSRVAPFRRGRAARFLMAAAALLAVAVGGAVIAARPATATWTTMSGTPTCDCVLRSEDGKRYKAVFGYVNPTRHVGRISSGDNNTVLPKSAGGTQATEFEPGTHRAAFASGWVDKSTEVVWSVGAKKVSANWSKPTCGGHVSLPADGNGTGPVVALALSLLVTAAVLLVRRRRLKIEDV